MNINNLKEGQIIKNYKELCNLLNIEIKGGKSKKIQLEDLKRYFNYRKEGNKFIIDNIYDEVKEKVDMRKFNKGGNNNIEYIKYIEALILNYLAEKEGNVIFLSKYMLLNKLKMINTNYSFCKGRIDKLSKFSEIDTENIYEFYASTDKTLIGNLEKALNNLANKSLIKWSKEKTVCECVDNNDTFQIEDEVTIDEFGEETHTYKNKLDLNYRVANDFENAKILYYEAEYQDKFNRDGKQDIVKHGEWKQFKQYVSENLKNDLGIVFYYDSYKIIFNYEHIYKELINVCDYLLTNKEIKLNENNLNKEIIERLKNNAIARREKALNNDKNNNTERRISDNYLEHQNKLIDMLIHKDGKSIKNKVRTIKLK